MIAVKSKAIPALSSGIRERGQLIERAEDPLCAFLKSFRGPEHLSEVAEHYRCSWSISSLVSSSSNLFVPLRTADSCEPKHCKWNDQICPEKVLLI